MKTALPNFAKSFCQSQQSNLGLLALLAVFTLVGCDSDENSRIEFQADQLSLTIPDRIRQVQELDIETVEAVATVNGQQYELIRTGEQFRVNVTLPSNSDVSISILFRQRLDDGGVLDLASYNSSFAIGTANETLQVFDNEFNDAPFDNDNDQISNLVERQEGTDPFVFDERPESRNFTISFGLPRIINDPLLTQVIATIAGTPRAVTRTGNNFEISGMATTRSTVAVEVILLQRLDSGVSLVLADATQLIASGVQEVSIQLTDDDFNFDRDQDNDGRTNLQELQDGTDPVRAD